LLKLRGARAGERFGIGQNVKIFHPSCLSVGHDVTILDGSYIKSYRPGSVRIGSNTNIHLGFWLDCGGRRDIPGYLSIGEDCGFQAWVVMQAGGSSIRIGNHVRCAHNVTIHAGSHEFGDPSRLIVEQEMVHKGVVIEDDCWLGAKVTVLDGVTIGRGTVVGAGAVVTQSLPPLCIAAGVPARIIGRRGE
jgi:acetyltransferase-like isoleucine patch superfamily enzyme